MSPRKGTPNILSNNFLIHSIVNYIIYCINICMITNNISIKN